MKDFVNIDSGIPIHPGASSTIRIGNFFMPGARIIRLYLTPESAKALRIVQMEVDRWTCALGPMVSPIDLATGRYLDSGSPSFDVPVGVPCWSPGAPLLLLVENLTMYAVRCIGTVEVDWTDRVDRVEADLGAANPLTLLPLPAAPEPPDASCCRCGELLTHAKHHWGPCPTPLPARKGYR